jgi:hypothetical protein
MAQAVAEGARKTGATVDVKRVPELVPADVGNSRERELWEVLEPRDQCRSGERCRLPRA